MKTKYREASCRGRKIRKNRRDFERSNEWLRRARRRYHALIYAIWKRTKSAKDRRELLDRAAVRMTLCGLYSPATGWNQISVFTLRRLMFRMDRANGKTLSWIGGLQEWHTWKAKHGFESADPRFVVKETA